MPKIESYRKNKKVAESPLSRPNQFKLFFNWLERALYRAQLKEYSLPLALSRAHTRFSDVYNHFSDPPPLSTYSLNLVITVSPFPFFLFPLYSFSNVFWWYGIGIYVISVWQLIHICVGGFLGKNERMSEWK